MAIPVDRSLITRVFSFYLAITVSREGWSVISYWWLVVSWLYLIGSFWLKGDADVTVGQSQIGVSPCIVLERQAVSLAAVILC